MILQPSRDVDAARRRAERIRIKARNITEQYADLRALVDEAERNEDHLALGYASWTAYVADLFGDEPLRLPRDARIPMSNMLAEKGMSNRAIGAVLGVDEGTVRNDRQTGAELSAPEPESLDERIDPATGEVELEEALDRVRALHHRRRHTLGDFVAYGQTEFPDLCDHCRSIYPCATVRALDAPACSIRRRPR